MAKIKKKIATGKKKVTRVKKKLGKAKKKIVAIKAPALKVGQLVPEFALPATGNKTVSLAALKGQKVVLFFYPKDSTPGCTLEGHEFTHLNSQFRQTNTVVLGVSRDSMKSHENFKCKQNYSVDLLSDADEKLCRMFGVIKLKNMYGKQVLGIERSTFVIDEQGVLAKEWRGVKPEGHAREVLSFITGL
ncbi:MAG: peroxiredoxin [Bdellovibrionales bacterium]|nr:peroxiredoxin [Bdellovibrionales bacterium]